MITLKINMRQLQHALMTTTKGTKAIVLPIKENNLFEGEKGIYLDIIGFELKNHEEGKDTHLLKQSFSKEIRDKMSDEQIKAIPIIGNARISTSGYSDPEPNDMNNGKVAEGVDDLPF
jgi:hypothetical protein